MKIETLHSCLFFQDDFTTKILISFLFLFSFSLSLVSPPPFTTLKKPSKKITQKSDPGAAPDYVKAYAESSTSIRVVWKPPPVGKRNGDIVYYKIFYVPSTRQDIEATMVEIRDAEASEFVIDELRKWTEYRLWMLAGTVVGDGPTSYPEVARTGEDGRQFSQQQI